MAETIDIAIVGGGPAGLTAAIYGARARVKTHRVRDGLPRRPDRLRLVGGELPGLPRRRQRRRSRRPHGQAGRERRRRVPQHLAGRGHPPERPGLRPHRGRQGHRRPRGDPRHRRHPQEAGHPRRGGVHRPGRVLVRHVRRSALPRQDRGRHRRRRLGHSGGSLPGEDRRRRCTSSIAARNSGPRSACRTSASSIPRSPCISPTTSRRSSARAARWPVCGCSPRRTAPRSCCRWTGCSSSWASTPRASWWPISASWTKLGSSRSTATA